MTIEIIKGAADNPVAKFFCSSPETDAFFLKRGAWSDEIVAFCRKIERERNEAREALDCLLSVIGLTPIAGNKEALQEAVDQGLVVLRKQEETK